MKFLVVTIRNGEILWVAQCKSRRGAETSAKYHGKLGGAGTIARIISAEELINWDLRAIAELESIYRNA